MFNFFSKEDKQLYNMLGHLNMAEKEISLKDNSETEIYEVACPDDEYAFLHEAAIIEYHGTLFAAWYNCEEKELIGPTPIRQKRSKEVWYNSKTTAAPAVGKEMINEKETRKPLKIKGFRVSGDYSHSLPKG